MKIKKPAMFTLKLTLITEDDARHLAFILQHAFSLGLTVDNVQVEEPGPPNQPIDVFLRGPAPALETFLHQVVGKQSEDESERAHGQEIASLLSAGRTN